VQANAEKPSAFISADAWKTFVQSHFSEAILDQDK
jgi:hypothetical protein